MKSIVEFYMTVAVYEEIEKEIFYAETTRLAHECFCYLILL